MKVKTPQQDDLTQLLNLGFSPRASLGNTTKDRKALAGSRAVPSGDKRRKPAEQRRDVQINFNGTADLRDLIADLARQHKCSRAELIDRAMRAFAGKGKP